METGGLANNGDPPPQRGLFRFLQQLLVSYMLFSFGKDLLFGKSKPVNGSSAVISHPASNLFNINDTYHIFFYLNDKESRPIDNSFQVKKTMTYGDWSAAELNLTIPSYLVKNGSIYLHAVIVLPGQSNDYEDEIIYKSYRVNRYLKKKHRKTINLVTGESKEKPNEKGEQSWSENVNCLHPNVTLNIVVDHSPFYSTSVQVNGSVAFPISDDVTFIRNSTKYLPIVVFNNYWNLISDYQPINSSLSEMSLLVTVQPISLFKYTLYASSRSKWSLVEEEEGHDDALKTALLETSPLLLAVTITASLLHTIFDFLAFKNDIAFWKQRNGDMKGVSLQSVIWNIAQQVIVFLYVLDNDTNFMVKNFECSLAVGLVLECWKLTKCVNVEVDWKARGIHKLKWSHLSSYVESETREYDQVRMFWMAFRYLSWLLFPALLAYASYSLVYEEQRGWYSWVLSTLYGFLLVFGFIMMTPQLFINYKLKSVAHLPWRMLTYKFLNTFIDDLFAFVIRMPTLYRIGCFRDDIVFLVYLYQRWAYRIDHSRINEFGGGGEAKEGEDCSKEERE